MRRAFNAAAGVLRGGWALSKHVPHPHLRGREVVDPGGRRGVAVRHRGDELALVKRARRVAVDSEADPDLHPTHAATHTQSGDVQPDG